MKCVDASLAAKWLFPEEDYSAKARALLAAAYRNNEMLFAPPHLVAEITNVVRQRMRRGGLSLAAGQRRLRRLLRFRVTSLPSAGLYERALELADRYGIDAAYDAVYLAQAQLLGVDLWTDDRRLLRKLNGRLPFVRWIAEYPVA